MKEQIKDIAKHEKDTGSSEVQIGLLTEKISYLSEHIKNNKKDKRFASLHPRKK